MRVGYRMIFYIMVGVTNEIVFTSLKSLYDHQDITLQGNTQLWVFGLYAGGGRLFEEIHVRIPYSKLRVAVYLSLIYILEYTTGWLLLKVLGSCPWHYYEPGNIHGLVQLLYIPLWTFFASVANKGVDFALNYDFIKLT